MLRLFLLTVSLLVSALTAAAGTRVALVVGNADYGPLGRLANPLRDAEAMAQFLDRELDFEVLLRRDVDYQGMQQAMTDFGRAAKDADVALFFYAGHGVELDGANYMLPTRADIRSDVDLVSQGYRLDRMVELMSRAGAKIKIVLVDACRNNPLPTGVTRGARGLQPLYATNTDTLIAFATSPGKVAFDGDGEHSPFTAALIAYLAKPDVEIQSMLLRVRQAVYEATRKGQFPWWDHMFLSEVYLGGRAGPDADDIALCERLGDEPSRVLVEAYIERYPDGFCAGALRKRLSQPADGAAPAALPPPPDAIVPPVVSAAPAVVPDAADGPAPRPYAVSSYWNHNGSLMALSAQGASRVFYYEKPRDLVARAGVRPGTLLFKGTFSGASYSGQAYLFSKDCGPVAYPVSGSVSADMRRVELRGERPVRDRNCRRIGTRPDRLVFEYRSKTP